MDESTNTTSEEVISQEGVQEETLEQEVVNEVEAEVQDEQLNTEQEAVEEEPLLSRRQQKAVDRVEAEAKEFGLNKILDRITQVKQPTQSAQRDSLDYRQVMDAPDEVYSQLEQEREQVHNRGYNEGLNKFEAFEFKQNLKTDLPLVQEKLSKLDPAAATALDRMYLQTVQYDSNTGVPGVKGIGYADFIDAQLELANSIASNRVIDSQRNIAKQAAQTGIRPDGAGRQGFKINSVEDLRNLSAEDYEKNREAIYRQAGIPYNK